MKKSILALGLALLAGFAVSPMVEAGWGVKGNCGQAYCDSAGCGQNTEVDQEAYDKFYEDTAELRELMVEKRSEYFAAMNEESPDKEYAALIWSEMFDLKEQLREKAEAAGIEVGPGMGGKRFGCRQNDRGSCNGPGAVNCYKNQDQDQEAKK